LVANGYGKVVSRDADREGPAGNALGVWQRGPRES